MLVYQGKIVQWLISSVYVLIPSSCGERPWKTRSWLTQHLECPTVCLKWNVHVATIPDPTHKCSKPSRVYPQTSRAWKSAPIQKKHLGSCGNSGKRGARRRAAATSTVPTASPFCEGSSWGWCADRSSPSLVRGSDSGGWSWSWGSISQLMGVVTLWLSSTNVIM